MIQRVMIDGIELPRLYIAEDARDVKIAKEKGIPFIRWRDGQETLIKMLLRPVLERMFPHIKWDEVLGERKKFRTKVEIYDIIEPEKDQLELYEEGVPSTAEKREDVIDIPECETTENQEPGVIECDKDEVPYEVADLTTEERLFSDKSRESHVERYSIEQYMGDMSSYVNIEMLQRLRLMPAFLGDILDCIKINLTSGLCWREGYNKRLGLAVGRYDSSRQLPNLIILDVSGSIPRGISATMISLIDTLRSQLSADLIITGSMSKFYPMGSELPTPQVIRHRFGYGNEAEDFFNILATKICGHHYGHVFSFGDNDTPEYYSCRHQRCPSLAGTTVEHVHHYHTYQPSRETGYAKWCHMLPRKPLTEYDTSWCEMIYDN